MTEDEDAMDVHGEISKQTKQTKQTRQTEKVLPSAAPMAVPCAAALGPPAPRPGFRGKNLRVGHRYRTSILYMACMCI